MKGEVLELAIVFLAASLVCVPLARRLGLGSVLGYLISGILIGPFVLGLVGHEGEELMHASELGVVMMLFVIGLELNPQAIWRMRQAVLGFGLLQVGLTGLALGLLFWAAGQPWNAALVLGLAFAMSSTAIALQTLKEKGLEGSEGGQSAFAVLLMQDIAVIPLLALLPLLALGKAGEAGGGAPVWASAGAVLALLLAGRYLINPFLRLVARARLRELFTISALLIVLGVAALMQAVGLSAALGAFLAGLLLANSEYRHELESDIEPFKGLLLGLFFTAVGSTINFSLVAAEAGILFGWVAALMAVKALVLLLIARAWRLRLDQSLLLAVLLAQVGEFAFVLLASASGRGILDAHTAEMGKAIAAISMALSPLLFVLNERFLDPITGTREQAEAREADPVEARHAVIIAGFGHFGSTVGRFLRANGVEATILDHDSDRVEMLRKMGFRVYYGDCTRLDLLRSAGAGEARYLVSALDSLESNLLLAELLRKHFPQLRLFMRSRNRYHAYEMMAQGIPRIYREALHSSVFMGADILHEMGHRRYTATRKAQEFIRYDEDALMRLAREWGDKERYILSAREEIALQERLMQADLRFWSDMVGDNAWDSEPRRGEEA